MKNNIKCPDENGNLYVKILIINISIPSEVIM